MLLPQLLNSHGLYYYLSGLSKKKSKKFENLKSEILSRSTSAILHILRINQMGKECLFEFELFEDQLDIKDNMVVFSSVSLGFLINEVSPLMSTLRLLQNLLIHLVRTYEGKKLPNSIADYFKKPDLYQINDKSKEILEHYWSKTGKTLKLYRDLDQHYGNMTDQYFMQVKPNKTILLRFPDNPEIKSPKKLKYDKNIDGLNFLKVAFDEIHETFELLAKLYGAEPKKHQSSISMDQLGDLRPARNRLLAFSFETKVSNKDQEKTLSLSGLGISQLPDLKLSLRQHFLDKEKLMRAKKHYGITSK